MNRLTLRNIVRWGFCSAFAVLSDLHSIANVEWIENHLKFDLWVKPKLETTLLSGNFMFGKKPTNWRDHAKHCTAQRENLCKHLCVISGHRAGFSTWEAWGPPYCRYYGILLIRDLCRTCKTALFENCITLRLSNINMARQSVTMCANANVKQQRTLTYNLS